MNKRELLLSITMKDFKVTYFSGKGPGGQSRNRSNNCVRLSHKESGASATGQKHKSKKMNERDAFHSIVQHPKFKIWHKRKIWEITNKRDIEKEIEQDVQKAVAPENLRIEVKEKHKKWTEVKEDYFEED